MVLVGGVLLAVGLQASVQTEAHQGTASPGASAGEVSTSGSFGIDETIRGFSAGLLYTPRLVAADRGTDLLHSGVVRFGFAASKTLRFSLTESVTYGRQDFSPLTASTTAPPPVVVPSVRFLEVVNSTTSLQVAQRFSPALTGSLGVSYSWGGALQADAGASFPQSRQPGLFGSLGWTLSKRDKLSGTLAAGISSSDNGSSASYASLTAAFARVFSQAVQASLSTGMSWTQSQAGPRVGSVWGLLPNAAASVSFATPVRGLSFSAGGALSPALDAQTGTANTSATASAGASWQISRTASASATGAFLRVVQGRLEGSETRQGTLQFSLTLPASFALGARCSVVDLKPVGVVALAGGAQWVASLQLGWAARTKL